MKWTDCLADKIHLEQLVDVDLVHGNVNDMLKVQLSSVFMPHSLGHLLGLDVHDVEGSLGGEMRLLKILRLLLSQPLVCS